MRLYLHETIDCIAGKVAEYQEALEKEMMPLADQRKLHCVGFFQVAGNSGRWPEMIALWEMEVADHLEQRRTIGGHAGLKRWMTEGAAWRRGGFDRTLLPHSISPRPVLRPQFKSPGAICLEQTFLVQPGKTADFVRGVESVLVPRGAEAELTLEGFWRSEFRPLEHIALWSMPGWDAYGRLLERRAPHDEASQVPGLDKVWGSLRDLTERILIPLRFSPLGGGPGAYQYSA
jgi:hypothetical protein